MLQNTPIKNSFIRLDAPAGFAACDMPQICLPVVNASDLSFQLTFLATDMDFMYMMQVNSGATFTIESLLDGVINGVPVHQVFVNSVSQGYIIMGSEITSTQGAIPAGTTFVSQISGNAGGAGTYYISNSINFITLKTASTLPVTTGGWEADDMGKMGCLGIAEGAIINGTPADVTWVMTAAAPTGRVHNTPPDQYGNYIVIPEWVAYFQPNGGDTYFSGIPVGACFSIYFNYIHMHYHSGGWSQQAIHAAPLPDGTGQLGSYTCFKRINDTCESYPTSVLQYANNSDAFGFYYDALGQLVDSINFLNSIRLPIYLHSPEQAEDQMNYQKSDGSTLKLSHRIWTDFKLKTDYLTADMHRALVAATAHDWVFVTCPIADLNPWMDDDGNAVDYTFPFTPTQFVRTEKIEVEWQQETMPRYKLGQAKGILRLALAESNVNTNCG